MATTPELHEPQIAAARAQAWHQAPAASQTPAPEKKSAGLDQSEISAPAAESEEQEDPEASQAPEDSEEFEDTEVAEVSSAEPEDQKTSSEPLAPVTPVAPTRILTLEAARNFVSNYGLVLFSPRSLGAPAPSLVEATLGEPRSSVTPADSETARTLVARMVAEGSAVPLNLLGGPGDLPDFVVSTAAFPFVFTLRGDKGWKRPPETSGAVKVTTLALHVYEVLAEKGALTVSDIVSEVGREITESAVTRSLSELWSLLRVIPSLQQGEGATLWELTTARFAKAVKAGANAGQPTALSALVSLYLGQVFLATEDEISAFLSPLTARSRVRDVLHGLSAGQQLSEAVLEGKTVLFLPDSLPDFASENSSSSSVSRGNSTPFAGREAGGAAQGDGDSSEAQPTERIRRFEGGADASRDRSFRGKPAVRPGGSRSGSPRPNSRFGGSSDRPAPRGPRPDDRPSRPFADRRERPAAGAPPRESAGDRPSFSRPWDEEKRDRPSRPEGDRPARPAFGARDSRPPRRDGGSSFGKDARPPFGNRDRGDRGDRPTFRRDAPAGAPPFRRRDEQGDSGRPFRSSFSPEGGSSDRGDRESREPRGENRPPRREGGSGGFFPRRDNRDGGDRPRPFRPAGDRPSGSFGGPRKSFDRPSREGADRPSGGGFRPREEGAGSGRPPARSFEGRPPFRGNGGARSFGDRPFGDRPPRPSGDRPSRPYGDRPARPYGDRPSRPAGDRPFNDRPARPFNDRPARDGEAPRSRPSGGFGDRGGFRSGGPSDRPSRGPGGGAGGFKRGAGGFSRGPGSFSRGPGGPPRGGDRGANRGPNSDRPSPRPRNEDEA